jgi:diguanylate cyclase (GGDEF)-like protein
LLRLYRRFGAVPSVIIVTVASTLLSGAITTVALVVLDSASHLPMALAFAVGLPVLISPVAMWMFASLINELERTNALLNAAATTDSLTSIVNRRGFFERVELALRTEPGNVLVAMVDLDNFKALNDRFGHQFGDLALQAAAAALTDIVGVHGFAARIGGDEFAVFASGDGDTLLAVRRRLLDLRRVDIDGVHSVGLSAGVSERQGSDSLEGLLSRADRALYANKFDLNARSDVSVLQVLGTQIEIPTPDDLRAAGAQQQTGSR